jgi:lysylphosphatidylglycerol synthetase-like protein (DUF2156 family)
MKNVLNPITLICLMVGLLFKIQHWPGANILVILSAFGMMISLLMIWKRESGDMPKTIHYLLWFTLLFFILGGIFRFMHWPFGNILAYVATFLCIITAMFLAVNRDSFAIGKRYFTIFFFFTLFLIISRPNNPIAQILGVVNHNSEMINNQMHPADSTHQVPADHY